MKPRLYFLEVLFLATWLATSHGHQSGNPTPEPTVAITVVEPTPCPQRRAEPAEPTPLPPAETLEPPPTSLTVGPPGIFLPQGDASRNGFRC